MGRNGSGAQSPCRRDVRRAFLVLGVLTALLGAVMCLA
jgi:hypothetical protein